MKDYNFKEIEKKWQKYWEDTNYGISADSSNKPKFYSLIEFPYPSGSGLHVGHCMMYSATDAHARMMRLKGYNVMFPMGWDAFGLPTENYAIKNKIKPQVATAKNVETFIRQQKSLGYSFDWNREINTTDPDYYKWTQWIFLQFYKHALIGGKLVEVDDDDTTTPRLAYRAEMPVNWCPSCKIILANEEVINGKCERCGTGSLKRVQKQWMLRITAYADKLIDGLSTVDYEEKIKTQQINWIGKSVGTNIIFDVKGRSGTIHDEEIEVFTTRADTLYGCTYVVLAPEHPLVTKLGHHVQNFEEVSEYISETKKKSDLERTELQKDKTGVKLYGVFAINPINGQEVDIYVADYVLASYGTGAVMAVPAHDDRDFEFAKKYGISTVQSITDKLDNILTLDKAYTDYGFLIDSAEFSGLSSSEGKKAITEKLKAKRLGDFAVNYKLRDWIFSRQHYWGEPIPIIHCDKCGMVPIPEDQLPLTLPDVENYEPTDDGQSPLAAITDWVETTCPVCGCKARRETDTMPNWAGSSWYFIAYAISQKLKVEGQKQSGNIFDDNKDLLDYWMPVDLYNGGNEHITLHLLYSRFWNIFLHDLGVVPSSEPYAKRINHGIILGPDGQKMSKSKGNVINPDEMAAQYGADTLRTYMMFIGPYNQDSAWSMAGIQGVFRFLRRVWGNIEKVSGVADSKELLLKLNQTILGVTEDLEKFQMNTVVSKLMELNNTIEKVGAISLESYSKFLRLLFVTAPHIASELWELAGLDGNIGSGSWPEVDSRYLVADQIDVVIQINGKVRGKISVSPNTPKESLEKLAFASDKIQPYLNDKEIVKIIVIPDKLVSIVVK
ncbi:MAG: leucine--tRNA ligase [Candidatus Berkelbacteria bacterium]|nr:leucine--tRNA ligase [Candidatus Berkelbacteria bacterium]